MKISPIGQYYTANKKQLPYSKKQNTPIFQRNYNIDKFSKQLASGVAAATGIMAGVSCVDASLKLDEKRFDEFLRENEWSPVRIPKIYYASPEQAKRIREILISNDKATEIPVLYLGLRDGRLFNDLEKHDLSAVPDILLGIEEEGNKIFKFGHYDDFLKVIYRFLYVYAEDLKNDEFTAKLQEVLDYVKEKRNLAYEDVSERIRESDGDTERILMTKQYQKIPADKNIKADIVKNTFENTQILSSSNIFVADKNAQNYKMGPWIFEKFLDACGNHLHGGCGDDQSGQSDQRAEKMCFFQNPVDHRGKDHEDKICENRQCQRACRGENTEFRCTGNRRGDGSRPRNQRRGERHQREIRETLLHRLMTPLHEAAFPDRGPSDQKDDKPSCDPERIELHTEDPAEHDFAGRREEYQNQQRRTGGFP